MDGSAVSYLSQNSSRIVRKLLARAYLREYRIPDALAVYQGLLRDYPGDADGLIVWGILYGLAGNARAAEGLYRRALEICPAHPLASQQLRLLLSQPPVATWDGPPALDADGIARLAGQLERVTVMERRQAVREAADGLERLASSERPSQPLGNLPADLQQLMPALIEQNIRQARSSGESDLADALQSLHRQITREVGEG